MDVDDVERRLATDLRRIATDLEVPGASVALAYRGHVTGATFGVINTRTGVAVTADTLFQIQSITKLFTATLTLQLVDDGLVRLDQPVRTYLPTFRTADLRASKQITVRHLLTHTGGFEGDLWQPTTDGSDALERFVSDLVSRARQYSAPGRYFSYCNAGFGTLGRLIEVLRGTSYETALRRGLLDPLDVDEVAFSAEQALGFRTAIGHVRHSRTAPARPTRRWSLTPPSNPAAGNQLAMSARGLLALGRLFLARGSAPVGTPLLSTDATALMLRPHLQHRPDVSTPSFQGLGWRLPRPGIAEHGGGMPGVASLLTIAPGHDLAAVVLTNSDDGAALARRLLDPVFADLAGSSRLPEPPPGDTVRLHDSTPFLGRYRTRQAELEVEEDADGRLWLIEEPQHEAAEMATTAGYPLTTHRNEIRRRTGNTFAVIDDTGHVSRTIVFLDQDHDGRFRLLATERLAARNDR